MKTIRWPSLSTSPWIGPSFVTVIFVGTYFYPFLTGQRIYFHDSLQRVGNMHLFYDALFNGRLPLWSHEINAGEPIWPQTDGIVPAADPIAAIVWLATYWINGQSVMAYQWMSTIWLALFALGGMLCSRRLCKDPWIQALVFALLFGGPIGITLAGQGCGFLFPFRYAPFVLLIFLRLEDEPSYFRAAHLGVATALSAAGYQTGFELVFLGMFAGIYLISRRLTMRTSCTRNLKYYAAVGGVAALGMLPTFIAGAELLRMVPISRIKIPAAIWFFRSFLFVRGFWDPLFVLNGWHGSVYLSPLPATLAVFALAAAVVRLVQALASRRGRLPPDSSPLPDLSPLETAWICTTIACVLICIGYFGISEYVNRHGTLLGLRNFGFMLTPAMLGLSQVMTIGYSYLERLCGGSEPSRAETEHESANQIPAESDRASRAKNKDDASGGAIRAGIAPLAAGFIVLGAFWSTRLLAHYSNIWKVNVFGFLTAPNESRYSTLLIFFGLALWCSRRQTSGNFGWKPFLRWISQPGIVRWAYLIGIAATASIIIWGFLLCVPYDDLTLMGASSNDLRYQIGAVSLALLGLLCMAAMIRYGAVSSSGFSEAAFLIFLVSVFYLHQYSRWHAVAVQNNLENFPDRAEHSSGRVPPRPYPQWFQQAPRFGIRRTLWANTRKWECYVQEHFPFHYLGPAVFHEHFATMEFLHGAAHNPISHQLQLPRYYALTTAGIPASVLKKILGVSSPVINIVHAAVKAEDQKTALETIKRARDPETFDRAAVIEGNVPQGLQEMRAWDARPRRAVQNRSPDRWQLVSFSPGDLRLQVSIASDGILLYRDNYTADWKVSVDGRPREVLIANVTNKAVFVPKGEHAVRFKYLPKAYIASFWIRVLFVLGFAGWWAAMLWNSRLRENPS